jgi:ribose transport system ATP-binding protein
MGSLSEYILEMKDIVKTFPGVVALDHVSISVRRGEIYGLVGENGAGKSTLMKILDGVFPADSGEIYLDGEKTTIRNTNDAKSKGIGLVFQEFNLINTLSVAENIYLNRLKKKGPAVDWKQINEDTQGLIDRLGVSFKATDRVGTLSAAQKQMVEIAKILSYQVRLIVMDEPTSSLTSEEIEKLFGIMRKAKSEGITIIYISHKLEEVFRMCDTTTVIRDGAIVKTGPTAEFTRDGVVEYMVGRSVDIKYPRKSCEAGEVILNVRGLTRGRVIRDVSFQLHRGEILGIAGLVGSGRTELAETLFGAERSSAGEIELMGNRIEIHSTSAGKNAGIGLLTEDRKETGLVLSYDLTRNISVTNLKRIKNRSLLSPNIEKKLTKQFAESLNVRTPSMKQLAMNLSGGNQQKVVFAKWLFSDADILILDEPTRGIDVGAKYEIYLLMNKLVEEGKAIIMISSELPEVLGMSDRVIVMSGGEKVGEMKREEATPEAVMHLAISN